MVLASVDQSRLEDAVRAAGASTSCAGVISSCYERS